MVELFYAFRPWLKQARRDFEAARKSLFQDDARTCSLLARQASEKALKAYYVSLHGRPPQEESVSELIKIMGLGELQKLLHDTEAGLASAKPNERSLNVATKIVEWAKKKLE